MPQPIKKKFATNSPLCIPKSLCLDAQVHDWESNIYSLRYENLFKWLTTIKKYFLIYILGHPTFDYILKKYKYLSCYIMLVLYEKDLNYVYPPR